MAARRPRVGQLRPSLRASFRTIFGENHMQSLRFAAVAAFLLIPAGVAFADDAPPPPPDGIWTGKGQFGFLNSRGNSDAESINGNLDMARIDGPWKNELTIVGLYGQSAGIVSAERATAVLQSNREISGDLFGFGNLRYEHDLFDGFEYQASAAVGLGYKIFDTTDTKLVAQVGVGYRRLRPEDISKAPDGAVDGRTLLPATGAGIVTLQVDYSQALTATTTLTNKFYMETGPGDTLIHDNVAVAVKVSNKLALSVGYGVNDNTNPPGGLKKVDTTETVNLVYSF
jgi:putative salt-induced outer membrane protein